MGCWAESSLAQVVALMAQPLGPGILGLDKTVAGPHISPLEDGLEEEEEECVSEENEPMAKDEFSTEENFSGEFETGNMSCEEMEYFCSKGEADANREAGDSEMDTQSEKTRLPTAGPGEGWDGPSKSTLNVTT
ncbi:hypothetical protein NHX12_000928 [Muraenolepis orangiensis]|uniref:Uncharacterized protein n=1 Tax=Muraenolepis orangiensis TaxID=630683 RepID=A0A9Q0IHP5_9TELE|nr:hypothetical protein NHX12_000928 [Muraenolepis orangiensis]